MRALAFRRAGDGPPLLLVNGYAATGADWDPAFVAALAARRTVLMPDNRGVGASPPPGPGALTVDGMAHDLLTLLDELGLERVAVAGWSMGGFVAQRLAVRAPERVRALALLSTDPGGPAAVPAAPGDWATLTDPSGTPREQATRLISLLFPPALAPAVDAAFGDVVATARAALAPDVLRAQEAEIVAWHAEPQPPLPSGPPPVLAAHGGLDVVIPPANLERLAARWPGCRTELVPGGGHAFMAQEPERVGALIAGFVAAVEDAD